MESAREIEFVNKNLSVDDKILEIMPFAGTHTLALFKKKQFYNYHLFELSEQPIKYTNQRLAVNDIKADLKSNTALPEKLPYDDGFFDAITIFQKLETLPDIKILSEIHRILKPGGQLFISFKNMSGLYGLYYWYKFRFNNKGQIWNYGPFAPLNYFKIRKELKKKFTIKKEIGISPLIFVGKTIVRFCFLGRLVVFQAIKK